MTLFARRITRRLFLKWLSTLIATVPALGNRTTSAHLAVQNAQAIQPYGTGPYGKSTYAGTSPTNSKVYMPVVNRGGQ